MIDLTGKRFGRLVATRPGKPSKPSGGGRFWICRCDCGAEVELPLSKLRQQHTKSCGCFRRDHSAEKGRRSITHGMRNTPTYRSWLAMKTRCTNPRHCKFALYGGAGVSICERWLTSFEAFLADMGVRPEGTTLDRFPDPAGDYKPGNTRWATPTEQRHNRRAPRVIELDDLGAGASKRRRY